MSQTYSTSRQAQAGVFGVAAPQTRGFASSRQSAAGVRRSASTIQGVQPAGRTSGRLIGRLARSYLRLTLQAASGAVAYSFSVLVGLTPMSSLLLLADLARHHLEVALGTAGVSFLLLVTALTVSARQPLRHVSAKQRVVQETAAILRAVSGSTLAGVALHVLAGMAVLPDMSPLFQVTGALSACLALNGLGRALTLIKRP